ncbi:hypothetical protein IG631_19401 [Alternaria alternata]|nr:hypothetical protein IG631_19401 [Alternaria alternata]
MAHPFNVALHTVELLPRAFSKRRPCCASQGCLCGASRRTALSLQHRH